MQATQSENYQRLIINEWSQGIKFSLVLPAYFIFSTVFLPLIYVFSHFSSKLLWAVQFSFLSTFSNFLFSMLNVIFYLFLFHLVFSFAVTFCLRLTTLPIFHYSSYCYRKNWINYDIRSIYSQTKRISLASRMKNAITNW